MAQEAVEMVKTGIWCAVLVLGLLAGQARAEEWTLRGAAAAAVTDVSSNSVVEILDSVKVSFYQDFKNSQSGIGSAFPLYRYRWLTADVGVVAPTDTFAGALVLGPSLDLAEPIQNGILFIVNQARDLDSHIGLLRRNHRYVSAGVGAGYNFRDSRVTPWWFLGVKVPI